MAPFAELRGPSQYQTGPIAMPPCVAQHTRVLAKQLAYPRHHVPLDSDRRHAASRMSAGDDGLAFRGLGYSRLRPL